MRDETTPTQLLLEWGFPIFLIVAGIAVIIYGIVVSRPKTTTLDNTLFTYSTTFDRRLQRAWEDVKPDLSNCTEVGTVLLDMVRSDGFRYRLSLVIPQESGESFVVVNESGACWVSGEKGFGRRPAIRIPEVFQSIFKDNRNPRPGETQVFTAPGLWEIQPLKDITGSNWAAMLVQYAD